MRLFNLYNGISCTGKTAPNIFLWKYLLIHTLYPWTVHSVWEWLNDYFLWMHF